MNDFLSGSPLTLKVYRAVDFWAISGVNHMNPVSFADELNLGDSYELRPNARRNALSLFPENPARFRIAPGSTLGVPAARLVLDSCLTFMNSNGKTVEILVMVETDDTGHVTDIYTLPLARLLPRLEYTLVGVDTAHAADRFAEMGTASVARGTQITLADGTCQAVEDLVIGDIVQTQDHGAQPIRWIGQSTLRAVGEFAPVCIKAGALHNKSDLIVSPDLRLYIRQNFDAVGTGQTDIMVRARHLLNGTTVKQYDGCFVDYFQLHFDMHEIVYMASIPGESLRSSLQWHGPSGDNIVMLNHPLINTGDDSLIAERLKALPNAVELLKRASST